TCIPITPTVFAPPTIRWRSPTPAMHTHSVSLGPLCADFVLQARDRIGPPASGTRPSRSGPRRSSGFVEAFTERSGIVAAVEPMVLDHHVVALDVTGFVQPLPKRGYAARRIFCRAAIDEPDHWRQRLLRAVLTPWPPARAGRTPHPNLRWCLHRHQAMRLIFDFSVLDNLGAPPTMTGEIDGLQDNTANQSATAIFIDSVPPAFNLTTPFSVPVAAPIRN